MLRFPFRSPRDSRRLSLTKTISAGFTTEAEAFTTLLIKFVSGEAKAGETRSGWMRVLAMEIVPGCVFFSSLTMMVRRS